MSAFIVSPETMHRAVAAIHAARLDYPGLPNPSRNALGRALYTLNIEAVQQRYPDANDIRDLPGWDGCERMPDRSPGRSGGSSLA